MSLTIDSSTNTWEYFSSGYTYVSNHCADVIVSSMDLYNTDGDLVVQAFSTGTIVNVDITTKQSGDIIQFGSYPQKKVTNSNLLSNLNAQEINWHYFNYYSGNGLLGSANRDDYMKYADVFYNGKKYRAITFSEYRPAYTYQAKDADSSLQDDNGYSTDTVYWFEYSPLNWKVVSPDEQTVVCKDIIDSQAYANTVFTINGAKYYNDDSCSTSATNWKSSSLREWLNNDFLHCAFSQDEIMLLSGNNSGDSTDKVWLPSSSVASSLKTSNNHYINYKTEYPQFYRTDYAKCQGAASDDYILSTKSNSTEGMGISTETQVITNFNYYQMNHYQSNVYSSSSGIRPMIKFASAFVDDYENTFNQTDVRIDVRKSDSNSLFSSGTKSVADGNEYTESTLAFCYKNKRNEEKTIDSDTGVFYIAHNEFPIRDIRIQGKVKTTTVTGTNGFSASLVYYSFNDSTPLYVSAGEIKNIYVDKIEHTPLTKLNNISSSSLGTVFTLGEYPQRRVTDGYLIEQLDHCEHNWQSYGYYSGDGSYASYQSDYMQYADINYADHKYRAVKFSHYRPTFTYEDCTAEKTLQDDHGYEPDTVYYFSYDPLQWKVIDGVSGRAICLNIIDAQAFNSPITVVMDGETPIPVSGNSWQGSELRSWLNDDFYNTAFSDPEKEQIKTTKVTINGVCNDYVVLPDDSDSGKIRTSNKVFYNYKTEDPEPIVTDYAKIQGVENDSHPTEKDIFYRLINPIDGNKFNRGTGIATRIQTITNYVYYLNNLNISNTYSTASGVRPVISMKNYYFDEFGQKYSAEDMRIEFRDADTRELLHPINARNPVEIKYRNKYYNDFSDESVNGVIHVNEAISPLTISSASFWRFETDIVYENDTENMNLICYHEYTMYDYQYAGTNEITGDAGDTIVVYLRANITKNRVRFTQLSEEEQIEEAAKIHNCTQNNGEHDWEPNISDSVFECKQCGTQQSISPNMGYKWKRDSFSFHQGKIKDYLLSPVAIKHMRPDFKTDIWPYIVTGIQGTYGFLKNTFLGSCFGVSAMNASFLRNIDVSSYGANTVRDLSVQKASYTLLNQDTKLKDSINLMYMSQFSAVPFFKHSLETLPGEFLPGEVWNKPHYQKMVNTAKDIKNGDNSPILCFQLYDGQNRVGHAVNIIGIEPDNFWINWYCITCYDSNNPYFPSYFAVKKDFSEAYFFYYTYNNESYKLETRIVDSIDLILSPTFYNIDFWAPGLRFSPLYNIGNVAHSNSFVKENIDLDWNNEQEIQEENVISICIPTEGDILIRTPEEKTITVSDGCVEESTIENLLSLPIIGSNLMRIIIPYTVGNYTVSSESPLFVSFNYKHNIGSAYGEEGGTITFTSPHKMSFQPHSENEYAEISYCKEGLINDSNIISCYITGEVTGIFEIDNEKTGPILKSDNPNNKIYVVHDDDLTAKEVIHDDNIINYEISYDKTNDEVLLKEIAESTQEEKDQNSACKYCGEHHTSSFWGRIIAFFHKIAYFFAHLFGKM